MRYNSAAGECHLPGRHMTPVRRGQVFTHHIGKPGFVYVVSREPNEFKIGHTKSCLRSRLTLLASELKTKMSLRHVIPSEMPDILERRMHDRFRSRCVGREWFRLSADEAAWLMTITPQSARLYVPEADVWYNAEEADSVYDEMNNRLIRNLRPSKVPGRFADMMAEYWADALGTTTDAFRSVPQ